LHKLVWQSILAGGMNCWASRVIIGGLTVEASREHAMTMLEKSFADLLTVAQKSPEGSA
jgi:hypothetical protein